MHAPLHIHIYLVETISKKSQVISFSKSIFRWETPVLLKITISDNGNNGTKFHLKGQTENFYSPEKPDSYMHHTICNHQL